MFLAKGLLIPKSSFGFDFEKAVCQSLLALADTLNNYTICVGNQLNSNILFTIM